MQLEVKTFDHGGAYFNVPDEVIEQFRGLGMKRALVTVNGVPMHCGLLNSKEFGVYIYFGKATTKTLGIKPKQMAEVTFEVDESEHQFDLPIEFAEVFETDPAALQVFESLTAGNRRSLIHLVAQLKSTDKRIERALFIAEKLKLGITNARNMR
jgi:Bacteriocin-protection, YdeI or OmpD-Associated/Domain of unknown function (DUF1905)